jgi:vancomycin resistance protein VanW
MIKADKSYFVILLPLAIFLCYWQERPFQAPLGEAHSRIANLNKKSKINIGVACKKIDNYVIKPGESFSFNHVVGPRTYERGFVSAPTYIGSSTSSTEGGGICLVSSLLYKAALESGLSVEERTPHSRTISTVLPGLDATVWYGRQDLKLKNTSTEPIKIHCTASFYDVGIELLGPKNVAAPKIVRKEKPASDTQVAVTVYLQKGDKLETISQDLYDRNQRPTSN